MIQLPFSKAAGLYNIRMSIFGEEPIYPLGLDETLYNDNTNSSTEENTNSVLSSSSAFEPGVVGTPGFKGPRGVQGKPMNLRLLHLRMLASVHESQNNRRDLIRQQFIIAVSVLFCFLVVRYAIGLY
jgi:hypothetical protein